MRTLDIEQARKLDDVANADPLGALYVTAVTTGMRQGELFAVRWADVDLKAGAIQVRRRIGRVHKLGLVEDEPKSDTSRRRIALTPLAVEVLRRHRASQNEVRLQAGPLWDDRDLVFPNSIGRPLEASNVRRRYHGFLDGAGLPRIRFHDLRHSVATIMLALGEHPKVVQEMLGHSDIRLTMGTYSHVLPGVQEGAVGRLGALLSAEG